MSLAAGSKLGPYEIVAAPAAGSLPVSGISAHSPIEKPRSILLRFLPTRSARWVRFVDDNAARLHHPADFGDRDLDRKIAD